MGHFLLPQYRPTVISGFLFLLLSFALAAVAGAEERTKYVTDILYVKMKVSPDQQAKSIKTLKSGDKLAVLEEKDRYSRIRLTDNTEGWIPTKYLTTKEPRAEEVKTLQTRIAALEKEAANKPVARSDEPSRLIDLEATIESATQENQRLLEENKALVEKIELLESESALSEAEIISDSADPDTVAEIRAQLSRVSSERDALLNELEALKSQGLEKEQKLHAVFDADKKALVQKISALEQAARKPAKKRTDLLDATSLYWFVAGAGVFFAGLLFGSRTNKRQRRLSY